MSAHTIDLLNEIAEFLEGQQDVLDGDDGLPRPNKAMVLLTAVEGEVLRLKRSPGPASPDSLLPVQRYTIEPVPGVGYQFTTTTDGQWVMAKDVADVGTEARTLMRRAVDYMGSANHFPSWVGEMEEFLSRFAATPSPISTEEKPCS